MTIAHTLRSYLQRSAIPYEVVLHRRAATSLGSAHEAHVEPGCMAKAVLLEADLQHGRYLVAVVPADRRVQLGALARLAGCAVHLATEEDAAGLFGDCETGAIPPVGPAYGVETIWEDSLAGPPVLYFEAGDHEGLVRVTAKDFPSLLPDCRHGRFSVPMH